MAVTLQDFLAEHPPDVDMRLRAWQADGADALRCVLEVNPWWREPASRGGANEQLVISFSGVCSSNVALGWRAAEIEDLVVLTDDPHLWPYGTHGTIFGNSRLPDPGRFFVEFSDLFYHELRAGGAVPFAFELERVRDWSERVAGYQSYQLLSGPVRILEAVRPLLDAQGVEYRLLYGPERATDHLQVAWVGESWVVCTSAEVEIEAAAA